MPDKMVKTVRGKPRCQAVDPDRDLQCELEARHTQAEDEQLHAHLAGEQTWREDPADAEVVDAEPTDDKPNEQPEPVTADEAAALVHAPPTPGGALIVGRTPTEVMEKAVEIADALADLIKRKNLSKRIGNKEHVEVGGWQALGTMLGAMGGQPLHAETVWTRPVADEEGKPKVVSYHVKATRWPKGKGDGKPMEQFEYDVEGWDWEARVEVRTVAGVLVGSAEGMCSRNEKDWSQRDDYAVRSMAETRAESRAYRRACGWLVHMAGYSPTPSEEMPGGNHDQAPAPAPQVVMPAWAAPTEVTEKLKRAITMLIDPGLEGVTIEPKHVQDVLGQIAQDLNKQVDGSKNPYTKAELPAAVTRSVLMLAVALRNNHPDGASGGDSGNGS